MSKMYVGYDGNYGSAEDYDFVIFDYTELTKVQTELLENDPADFYLRFTGNDWDDLEKDGDN